MSFYLNPRPGWRRRLGRLLWRSILVVALIGLLLFGVYLVIRLFLTPKDSPKSALQGSTYEIGNNMADYNTDYFHFRANKAWEYLKQNSTDKKYVYAHHQDGLVDQQFQVYIDTPPVDNSTSYLAKVMIQDGKQLQLQSFSQHCINYVKDKANHNQQLVSYLNTAFLCRPDSQVSDVAVGAEGDGTALRLHRQNGSTATYYLYFRDSRFTPEIEEISSLIDTFVAR